MEENIWKYGQYELDKKALLKYLQSNAESYTEYQGYDDDQKKQFNSALGHIISGIENGTISGNGLGKFTERDIDLGEDDVTKYINTVANAMGEKFSKKKEEEKEQVEEKPEELEDFDYSKHGLYYSFNKENNPFGTDANYDLWKSKYTTQDELNTALADYIGQYRTKIGETKRNWKQIDQEHYNSMLSDLENDIRINGIQDSDKLKLKSLGFNPDSFVLQQQQKSDSPWGHIKWDNQTTNEKLPEEAPTVPEGFKAVLQQDGSYEIVPENENVNNQMKSEIGNLPINEYINNFKTLGLEESDGYRLAGLLLDVSSIINPEPFTAAGMGYASDYLNYHADELDGINDSWWDDALNVGLSTLGAIPLIGDLGMTGKVAKNLIKTSKSLGKLLLIPGIFAGVANSEELKQSVNNIINNDFTVNDLRNTWTVLQLALGTTNAIKSGTAKKKAANITQNADEALVVQLKNNGKTQNYQFSGKDKEDLLALKDKPEEFNKYIRENFEGLDKAEAAKIKTTRERDPEASKFNIFAKRKIKSQEVQTTTKPVIDQNNIPGKWNRSRYFLEDSAIKTKRKGVPNQSTSTTPKESEEVSFNVTTGKYETKTASEKIDQKIADDAVLNKLGEAKSEIGQKPEEKKIEIKETPKKEEEKTIDNTKEKTVDYTKAREAISKNKSVKATEIEPDIKSKATETVDTKSEVTKYNASNIRKEFDKLKGKSKKKAKWVLKNAKQDKELADLVKQDPSLASKDFNEMLAALQNADKKITYEQAFKILTEAGFYKEGGIIKAETGTKVSGTPRNNNLWYSSIGSGFMHKLAQGLINGDYTYQDINMMQDRHFDLDNLLSKDVDNPSFNQDVQNYYNDINNHFKFVNTDGIKLGEDNSRYKIVENAITKDSHQGGWVADGYYSGRGQDRMLLGKRGDYTDEELSKTMKFWENAGFKMYLDDKTNYYKIDPISTIEGYEGTIKIPEVTVTATYPGGPKTPPQEKVEISKPEKPNQSFFTTDKALAVLNYFRARGHNKEQLDLANRMVPLLYDPMEHHRSVYGNLRAISEGNRAAGEIRSRASKPLTSDGSLQTAGQLEAENLAQQYIRQGWQSDDETMQKMSELAWQQEKENRENRYNIAMKNRENMHQVSKEKLMALMGKKRADYESLTNHINEWRTWIGAKQQADEDKANILFNRQMLNYIQNNPQEYISNWKLYEKLWNRYNNGETLSADEQRTISQIQNHLSNAYYNEIYGKGDYFGYGITRSPWNPILKKGGTITKNQVDSIIKYLKESNNNYNRAIDRSIKGLYNHIKLQRKK